MLTGLFGVWLSASSFFLLIQNTMGFRIDVTILHRQGQEKEDIQNSIIENDLNVKAFIKKSHLAKAKLLIVKLE